MAENKAGLRLVDPWESPSDGEVKPSEEVVSLPAGTTPTPDFLGQLVRIIWVNHALNEQKRTGVLAKPSNLLSWDDLDEPNKDVDRQIGLALFNLGRVYERSEGGD